MTKPNETKNAGPASFSTDLLERRPTKRGTDMTFKEWFKSIYVQRGFVSSEKELAEAFEAGAASEREASAMHIDVPYVRAGSEFARAIRLRSNAEVSRAQTMPDESANGQSSARPLG